MIAEKRRFLLHFEKPKVFLKSEIYFDYQSKYILDFMFYNPRLFLHNHSSNHSPKRPLFRSRN
jgi:hypothetical protein